MTIMARVLRKQAVLAFSVALVLLLSPLAGTAVADSPLAKHDDKRPNILYFIMDDVGIDQMQVFGYGGLTPPRTPNIDAIARAGVRFANTWAMPECSPTRALFFEGRFSLRTNVSDAILSLDLANSQVSPFEITTPRVLRKRSYESGLFGKFHLSGTENNPFGDGVVHALGWDFFAGYLEGFPLPIDTTAGGVAGDPNTGEGPYMCGFVPNATDDPQNGADTGACFFADSSCTAISESPEQPTPGRACLNQGGIFVRNQSCGSPPPDDAAFNTQNAYYVSQLIINHEDGRSEEVSLTDPSARTYRSTIESDLAIEWITERKPNKPWMATVSYSSAHAPFQQPPTALLPPGSVATGDFDCSGMSTASQVQQRVLSNQMTESLDTELGRVMVEVGLATRNADGTLDYHPETTDTMVVILGDNGTFGPVVKEPFDAKHAKGFVYQTGVWVPLIVAGPLVDTPDREVRHMVNVADLFELFGEIAGVDVRKVVPKSHILDSASMLPYLTNPDQESIRQSNFTQTGVNITADGVRVPPCVISSTCSQLIDTQPLCEFEGGVWFGPPDEPDGLTCCDVIEPGDTILADSALAIRNDRFKLVQSEVPNCATGDDDTVIEFYEIDELAPIPRIERPDPDDALFNNSLRSQ